MQSLKDLNDFYNKEKRNIAVVASFKAGNTGKFWIWLAIVFLVIIVLLLWLLYLAV